MQYLDLINNFWRIDEQRGFNGNETRLYFFLLHLANRSFWNIEWLEYGDEKTKVMLGISSVVLRTAREKLKEALLIDFITGGRGYRVKTRYKILTPNLQSNPIPNPEPLYNKTKTKNKINQSDNFVMKKMEENIPKGNSLPPGVISMSKLDICLESLKMRFSSERKDNENIRFVFPFEYDEYVLLLTQSANTILEKRREKTCFVIDSLNESIIEQLYFYLRMDGRFSGDLRKGIMLMGKYGCGKTIIMQAITEMYNTVIHSLHIQRPLFKFFKSSDLQNILKVKPIGAFSKMPLIIDEFGREPKQVMDFGNLRSPMIELLCERYDNGAWTNGTSNFTLDTLCSENQYGKMTGDRLKSMFNFIELKGDSRRE